MVVLNWQTGVLRKRTLAPGGPGINIPFQLKQGLLPDPLPDAATAQTSDYDIYFKVQKIEPATGETIFKTDVNGRKIPYGFRLINPVSNGNDYLSVIGYPPGVLKDGTYSNALHLSTIRLGAGDDTFAVIGTGITQKLSSEVSKEESQGYIFQSNIFAGAGDDMVRALMPFQSTFKGGSNTLYHDAKNTSSRVNSIPITLSEDLTLEEVSFGDTIELKGSRFDWDIEFRDVNKDSQVTLASILNETDCIITSNNNQIFGFERILFGDILFDLILARQQDSSAIYGQPDYYLNGAEDLAPELNSSITKGSLLWEAFRFNRTKLEGISGTATNKTNIFTGSANDTPFIKGTIKFTSLNTEAGGDLIFLGNSDQSAVDLGADDDQIKIENMCSRSSIVGGSGNDNIIINSSSRTTLKAGTGDDVIEIIKAAFQSRFDGGAGTDTILLPDNLESYLFSKSTSQGKMVFADKHGNRYESFEIFKFNDVTRTAAELSSGLEKKQLFPTKIKLVGESESNEGSSSTYAVYLDGTSLRKGQSISLEINAISGTATESLDFTRITSNDILTNPGVTIISTFIHPVTKAITLTIGNNSTEDLPADYQLISFSVDILSDSLIEKDESLNVLLKSKTATVTNESITTLIQNVGGSASNNLNGGLSVVQRVGGGLVVLADQTSLANQILNGSESNDIITGGLGNDAITGAGGADYMLGRGGRDIFKIRFGDLQADTITDFTPGADKINIISTPANSFISQTTNSSIHQTGNQLIGVAATVASAEISSFPLVYLPKVGGLYINNNGILAGFGSNGGLIAYLPTGLSLSEGDFMFGS